MPRFAANIWYLFQEVDLTERFRAAAEAGFKGIETQFPYAWPRDTLAGLLDANGLKQVLINAPPGDWAKGERGIAALPGREQEFRAAIAQAIEYAQALGCANLHVMAGIPDRKTPREKSLGAFADNLLFAADACGRAGIRVLVEALNPTDVPGYLIGNTADALGAIARADHPNLYLQYDLYHGMMNGEDLLATVRANLDAIGHMQVAGCPGRHEPEGGAVDYAALLQAIDATGYSGWIGCEYRPKEGTRQGLGWARAYGIG